ncbi:hypothetical protein LPJ53_002760 [Coemansia erecta]|uniref:CUE domain-containing protein n=1 Tax=Coemansia erecta TaxID=147472 RepID=A0A9W7Y0P6_9FUNG|nr:hypothetical protein LPJ53_002760 [Coemansia erecta]
MNTYNDIHESLAGPSDSGFIRWLLDQSPALLVDMEAALLEFTHIKATANLQTEELVLSVYEKLGESLLDSDSQELARGLQGEYILVGATLFDLAKAFGRTHPQRLARLITDLIDRAPWLAPEIEASSDLFVDQLSILQTKYLPDSAALSTLANSGQDGLKRDSDAVEGFQADLEWHISMVTSWIDLLQACPRLVSVLVPDKRCLLLLTKVYDLITASMLRFSQGIQADHSDKISHCIDATKRLKWGWSGLWHCLLSAYLHVDESSDRERQMDAFSGESVDLTVFMDVLDSMATSETQLVPFSNAPFLLDMEFRFGIRKMLSQLLLSRRTLDDAQVDYIVMSIDQLVDMTDPVYRGGLEGLESQVSYELDALASISSSGGQPNPYMSDTAGTTIDNESNTTSDADPAAVAQVKELIPDLGSGFIRACLDYYGHNPEAVIVAIFEENLPPTLAEMDRTSEHWNQPADPAGDGDGNVGDGDVAESALANRRNIFDNDEFDIFNRDTLDWSRVNLGKARLPTAAEAPSSELKSRVIQIAQRIEDDDEYDDTYDDTAQDGVLDMPDTDENQAIQDEHDHQGSQKANTKVLVDTSDPTRQWEDVLIRQVISDPTALERKKGSRKLPARQALRDQTGLSDEQLEGWFIMFQRNPRKQQQLDMHGWKGEQPAINSTAKQADQTAGSSTGESRDPGPNYKHKEKNKAKIANHNRKQQQARKTRNTLGQ